MIQTRSLTKNLSYSNLFIYNSYALHNTRTVLLGSEIHRLLHFLSRPLQWHSSKQQGYSLSQPNHNQKWNYNLCTLHRLHNEQLHGLYYSPNIIRSIKSRKMRWDARSTHGKRIGTCGFVVGKPQGRSLRKTLVDLQELRLEAWNGLIWLRIGTGGWHL
jgi:hypothetical protein